MVPHHDHIAVIRRGALSGLTAMALLGVAAIPARLSVALHGHGAWWSRLQRVLGGSLLDLSSVIWLVAPAVALLTLATPVVWRRTRVAGWQRWGAIWGVLPFGAVLWALSMMAQEVKSERGSFPTMFDVLEGGTNAAFVEGSLGFLSYLRVWLPALVGLLGAGVLLSLVWRRPNGPHGPWRSWALGLVAGLSMGAGTSVALTTSLGAVANEYTSAALGDPLTGLMESTIDLLRHQGPATPRELVLSTELPEGTSARGAQLMGWPPSETGARRRPVDFREESQTRDARGRQLLEAFWALGEALFSNDDSRIAVFQLSLEGFRADDLHALNPHAPRQLAPFVNALYENSPGVVAGRAVFQAGVRTAHGLGAMSCGLGTLPYNLSFIRDLQPFPVRCLSDVLSDAGFAHSFFYGSDLSFDDMGRFFQAHGYSHVVSQPDFSPQTPKGTWEGITDFAVFDRAVKDVSLQLDRNSQFAMVMSLSNHSPFTAPEDLPKWVEDRVELALRETPNRADSDDRLRLMTFSYTDAAVQRLVESLDSSGLSERSLVFLMADHSTGHAYVWGDTNAETDAAKAQIPFALIIPQAFLRRAKDDQKLRAALEYATELLNDGPLSLNDVPSLILAMLSAHPSLKQLPAAARWHTMGGQITSPYFAPREDRGAYVMGINGVSELFVLNRGGQRLGSYEDSVFLKTRADRYRVTPALIPVTATLIENMKTQNGVTPTATER